MSNIKPDKNGNYTEEQWDNLPVAKRMRLCASGEYEIQRSDMTDAANYIKKLETSLKNAKSNIQKQGITFTDIIWHKGDRIEKLEAALREIADGPRDADKSYVSLFHEIQSEARKALEGKDD